MLKTRFVPVAIDQAYQRRQQDAEGEFYRKIAGQGPRNNFESTTQGFYIATADGELLLYNNNRDPEKLRRLMRQKLDEFSASKATTVKPLQPTSQPDPRYNVEPPAGGLVVRVHAKVLDGYPPTTDRWQRIFQTALSRDNLWITREEHEALVAGRVPDSLQRRIARFHLVDNTRGEPPMWKPDEVRQVHAEIKDGRLSGSSHLETNDGQRGYQAEWKGSVEVKDGAVTKFDVVVLGSFWGEGPFTGNAPEGKFPLAISLTLADGSDIADRIPPQGSRGWLPGYLR